MRLCTNKTGLLDIVGQGRGGSAIYRRDLTSLVKSGDSFTVLGADRYTTSDGTAVSVTFGLYDQHNRAIVFDFADFDKHPQIDLGLAFYHEAIGHGLKNLRDQALFPWNTATGATKDVGIELDLPFQAQHETEHIGDRLYIRLTNPLAPSGSVKRLLQEYRLLSRGSTLVDVTD